MEGKYYSNALIPSSQFVMCGNCFRADMYHGCSFGCEYCFANNRGGKNLRNFTIANIKNIRKQFECALDCGDENTIVKECLKHHVPIHLGGLSDPFQECETKYRLSYEFLKLTKQYNYPVNISTKTSHLEDMYWDVLDPNIHTFSISLMGYSDEYIRLWEKSTPPSLERIAFVKELKERGFWVSIRIQPIIDMDEVLCLIKNTEHLVNFYTVEHLKLPVDNASVCKKLLSKMPNILVNFKPHGREYEFPTDIKIRNIETIKRSTNVKIGCGDNDIHILSDCLNCCGVDMMPKAFNNWLKYNSMYLKMTGDRSVWSPTKNCHGCLNGDCVIKGLNQMKQYVDRAYNKQYGNPAQLTLF